MCSNVFDVYETLQYLGLNKARLVRIPENIISYEGQTANKIQRANTIFAYKKLSLLKIFAML